MSSHVEEITRVKKTCRVTGVAVRFDHEGDFTEIDMDQVKGLVWTDADVPHRDPNPEHGPIEIAICKRAKRVDGDMCVLVNGNWQCKYEP